MKFKDEQGSLKVHRILFVIVPLIIFLIVGFAFQNSRRIYLQNQIYTKEAATNQAESMDELIDYCSGSILMYADTIDGWDEISKYEKNSPFESLFLIGKDGILKRKNKEIDISSTDIFLRGFQGKTGIMVDYDAAILGEVTIVFYAPVMKKGVVDEVVVGILSQSQLEKVMDTESFGFSSVTYLVSTKGKIISGSKDSKKWIGKNLFNDYHKEDTFLETTLDELPKSHITKKSLNTVLFNGGSFGYSYKHNEVRENAYLITLNHSDFALMKVFPSKVTVAMESSINRATAILAISLIFLFGVYLVFVVIDHRRQNGKLKKENETVRQILEAFYGIYYRFCIIDLTTDTYRYLQFNELDSYGIEREGKYTQLLQKLSLFVYEDEIEKKTWTGYSIETLRNLLHKEHPVLRKEVFMELDGGRWENLTFIGLDYENEIPRKMIFAIQDITNEHEKMVHINQMLKEASKDASAANAAKSDFLSRMSHDIRTPLNGILGMVTIAKHQKNVPEKILDCLNKIDSSGEFLLGLINEILDISKIESGKMMLDKENMDLNELLEEIHNMIQINAKKKNQQLIWNNHLKHCYVIADKNRLKSIILNILSNAVKYTLENGRIEFTVSEGKTDASSHAVFLFECKDNGIGMSEEFLDTIFEPFARAEDEVVQSEQGSGLGLSIIESMARLMGGGIHVSSKLGVGSTFTIHLPLEIDRDVELSSKADEEDDLVYEANFKGYRCLLVEDNELNLEIACELLKMTQIEVETACNGKEAVELFKKHSKGYYQMIFMDVQMPVMNGYEATRMIRSLEEESDEAIPIIAMTANAYAEDVKAALDAGMNEHLAKPINLERLHQVMRKYLRG